MVASGWQVDTGRQVDTALGLSESSSTLCSAGHSSSATCDAAFQLGGQVGSARLVRRLSSSQGHPSGPVTTLSPRQHTCPTHHSLIASALSLVAILKCQVQPESGAAVDEHIEFSADSPLPPFKMGGGPNFTYPKKHSFQSIMCILRIGNCKYKHFSAHFYQFLGPGDPKMAKNKQIPEIWCAQWHLPD